MTVNDTRMDNEIQDMVLLEEEIDDHWILCEFAFEKACPKKVAEWMMHTVPCPGCARPGFWRLACDTCKRWRMESESTIACHLCGEAIHPARHGYDIINRL